LQKRDKKAPVVAGEVIVGVGAVPAGEKLPTLVSGDSLNTPGLSVHQSAALPNSWDMVRI